MHGCILSTADIDALMQKHQAISIHIADKISIVLEQFHTERLHQKGTALENIITFWKATTIKKQFFKG